jgi:hypothetical protein
MAAVVAEKRRTRRRVREEHGIIGARVRPGYEVDLVDVCAGGALVQCARRLLPGALIELHLIAGERAVSVRGRILRSSVVQVRPTSVCYRAAIGFERDLPWFSEHAGTGYSVPTREPAGCEAEREDATRATL